MHSAREVAEQGRAVKPCGRGACAAGATHVMGNEWTLRKPNGREDDVGQAKREGPAKRPSRPRKKRRAASQGRAWHRQGFHPKVGHCFGNSPVKNSSAGAAWAPLARPVAGHGRTRRFLGSAGPGPASRHLPGRQSRHTWGGNRQGRPVRGTGLGLVQQVGGSYRHFGFGCVCRG